MKYLGIKIFLLFFLANSYAVTIKDVSFSKSKENGTLKIFYNGIMRSNPEMTIRDKEIFISIPKANLIKSIDKKENFSTNNQQDTQIKVKKKEHSTDVSLVLPFNIEQKHERVSMLINDKYLKVTLPRVSVKNVEKPVVINKVVEPKKEEKVVNTKPVEEVLGEGYLNKLIAEKKSEEKKVFNKTEKDVVKTTQASTEKSKFSLLGYAGKFVAFLGFVLLFFYGIVLVFKKGVFSKGKLGFLNNTNQITVLST